MSWHDSTICARKLSPNRPKVEASSAKTTTDAHRLGSDSFRASTTWPIWSRPKSMASRLVGWMSSVWRSVATRSLSITNSSRGRKCVRRRCEQALYRRSSCQTLMRKPKSSSKQSKTSPAMRVSSTRFRRFICPRKRPNHVCLLISSLVKVAWSCCQISWKSAIITSLSKPRRAARDRQIPGASMTTIVSQSLLVASSAKRSCRPQWFKSWWSTLRTTEAAPPSWTMSPHWKAKVVQEE